VMRRAELDDELASRVTPGTRRVIAIVRVDRHAVVVTASGSVDRTRNECGSDQELGEKPHRPGKVQPADQQLSA
jgi:hypothetical protein